jgi:selenocysteine lyase/cysteine desulfurase
MPQPTIDAMIEFERKIASGGTIGFDEEAETGVIEKARDEAANLLGASRDEVAILSSASQGICSFAWSLDLNSGQNVVSTDADFPSVVYPWMRIGREKGVDVRLAKNHDGVVDEEELERLVDDRTAVISISHVEYGTGQRFDLRWLSELAHSHGALLVVDASQSAGLVPIDVHRDDVDGVVAAGYKGVLGPFGAAIFYVKEEVAEGLEPPFTGWRSTPTPYDLDATRLVFADSAKKFEYSTMNYASCVGLAKSLEYLRGIGYVAITDHVLSLSKNFIARVKGSAVLRETTALTPEDERHRASIASFRFRNREQSAIAAGLVKRGVVVSQRFNGVRFSFHAYNGEQDLCRAIQALEELVAR